MQVAWRSLLGSLAPLSPFPSLHQSTHMWAQNCSTLIKHKKNLKLSEFDLNLDEIE